MKITNLGDLYSILENGGRVDLIDPIEDFRDALLERISGNSFASPKEIVELIKREEGLLKLALKITEKKNIRGIALKLIIAEILQH